MLVLSILAGAMANGAMAERGPTLSTVEIRGLRRVQESVVRDRISHRKGVPLDTSAIPDEIKRIFSLGYFRDVRVEMEIRDGGLALIYIVTEKPGIRRVEISGNEDVDDEKLKEALTISPGSLADEALIRDNAEALRKVCEGEGYPLAVVLPVLRQISESHATLTFQVEEGPRVKIDRIIIEGNEHKTNRQVKKAMKTSEWWFMSWLASSGRYNSATLADDREKIQAMYNDDGYIKAETLEPEIAYHDEKRWMDITLRVIEGGQYSVSGVSFEGDSAFDQSRMAEAIKIKPGEPVSRKLLTQDVAALNAMHTDNGYALASIYPDVKPSDETHLATVTYRVTKGDKYKVGRINITGNDKTRDKVIRREFRLFEGQEYSAAKIRQSYQALNNLNYFESVNLDIKPDAYLKRIDIDMDVKEKSTGSFNVGGGYSTLDKFVGMVDVTFGNFGGRGQYLKVKSEFSSKSTMYEIEFRDPWFLDTPWSFSTSIYNTERDYTQYVKSANGFTVGFGRRLGDYWKVNTSYKLEKATVGNLDTDVSNFIKAQKGTSITSAITPSVVRDTRDNYIEPHTGSRHSTAITLAGLGGDNKFVKYTIDSQYMVPVSKRTELSLRGRYGFAKGLGGQNLPLYERFFVGSSYTVRGLREIGPKDEYGDYVGGGQRLIFNLDYTYPLNEEAHIKGTVFFDAGTAFDREINLRRTAGFGVNWISPLGPLRLEWAMILHPEPGEPPGRWEFSIGSFF